MPVMEIATAPGLGDNYMSVKRLNVNINSQDYRKLKLQALLDGVTLSELVKLWIADYLSKAKQQ